MFVRIWHKPSNIGNDDIGVEEYFAIRYITRFYARKYKGDIETRYIISTGAETAYVTKKTFQYLKSLRTPG